MNHEIVATGEADLIEKPGRIIFDYANSASSAFALGLALLNEDLVDAVVIRPLNAGWVLRLRRGSRSYGTRFRWYAKNHLDVDVVDVELERWLGFFLKSYRDGSPEVDHLDVEGTMDDGVACNFTLKVADAAPPVSDEEARRRLGL